MSNKIIILVVDDNPINRQYFSMALIKAGFEVVLAENGFDAIEKAQDTDFDLILIDIRMPDMDGYEATTRIKLLSRHINTPVIATSAENIDQEKGSIFNDFILKPISPKILKQTIEKYCGNNKSKIFNKDHALKYAYDDEDIMQNLLTMFINDLPKQMSHLEIAVKNENTDEIYDLIHKTRGSCKACGADELDSKLEQLAIVTKQGNTDEILSNYQLVKNSTENYLTTIEKLTSQ